jgi:hypothetical protein
VVAFGLEHYMHHKYHSHHDEHHHDETHGGGKGEGVNENKTHQSHSPKEFSAETASLDEITKEMTRLRKSWRVAKGREARLISHHTNITKYSKRSRYNKG